MKLIIIVSAVWILMMPGLSIFAQDTDPVKKANEQNEAKADKKIIDEDAAKFLVKAADARMMDLQEGKLAVSKGTTPQIRSYGQLMVKDQTNLLAQIKKLAASKNITLPAGISDDKQEGREDLSEKSGKDFDEKFVKMMRKDHQRDVKLFKEAADGKDADISKFAAEKLPLIETHLEKINAIKDKM